MKFKTLTMSMFLMFLLSICLTPVMFAQSQDDTREIHIKVLWDNKPLDDMNIYLLNSDLNFINKKIIKTKAGLEVKRESFYEAYKFSTQEHLDLNLLSNKSEKDKKIKILIKNLIETINLYRIRKDISHLNGETYINIEAGERYYLVVLKDNTIYSENEPFTFWMEEIFFPENVYQEPKEITLTRSNAIVWK